MRVPLSWLREHVPLPESVSGREVADRLTAAGLQVERVEAVGHDISGVVVAQVLALEELSEYKKPVRWVTLSDGATERQVICGATNFDAGDLVAYARPPAGLPGGLQISARRTYDHVSDGMICSGRELGLSDDHSGILVLEPGLPLGADVVSELGLREDVLDLSVNPDRGYALSIRGVAREVATAYELPFEDPADPAPEEATSGGYPVTVEDPAGCDRYVARTLAAVDPGASSPVWLQRRLALAGMRPVSLVVDVTNHVMLELGQPMHAFDRSRLSGPIVVRRARPGERLTTLDGVERVLDPDDLVIADDSGPVALAGVMGGAATEIRADTREVVLESAHFDAVSVAVTARRHRLPSEASRRYERGVDDALAPAAAAAAIRLLEKLGGATASGGTTDVDSRPAPVRIRCAVGLPGRIAGVDYPPARVLERLRQVGCDVQGTDELVVTPPSWRPDLRRDVDLVEEVVRLEGYDGLPSTLPKAPAGGGLTRPQRLRRQAGRSLAGAGLVEVLTLPFVDAGSAAGLLLEPGDRRVPSVRVANPVSEQEPFLRASLLPGLFATVTRNLGRGLPDIALYEIGPVFRDRPDPAVAPRPAAGVRPSDEELAALDAALPDQPRHVGIVLTGLRQRSGWWGHGRAATWADAVEVVRTLASDLGVAVRVASDRHAPFHPGRCAALHTDSGLLGHAGELHPRVVASFDLPPRTCAAEISLDRLLDAAPEVAAAPRVSAYPPATLDIALVVADQVPAADVEAAVRSGAGNLLESLRLFDVYTGEQVGAGHRSLAFSLRLRAPDRTLTAEEVARVRDAAVAEAGRRVGAELRTV